MSLEQMKDILRKSWRNSNEDAHSPEGAPETVWAPLQVPVQITIRNASGAAEIHQARTLAIHAHGAKLECIPTSGGDADHYTVQPPFSISQTLWIEVLSTHKSDGAEVVWANAHRNADGNFEIAVELGDARSLFDVSPPTELHTPLQLASPAETPEPLPKFTVQTSKAEPANPPMTDRMAGLFREVIESALQQEQHAISAEVLKEIRQQFARDQQAILENVRQEIAQEAAALEEQLLQQCRSRTEHMLAVVMKTALTALSNQIDEMSARTQKRVEAILKDLGDQLEQRSAHALAEIGGRFQERLEKSAAVLQEAILRKMLAEITDKQKHIVEQAQGQIALATEQNLVKLRGGLIRALQELINGEGKLEV
jgi:hypothetical protein